MACRYSSLSQASRYGILGIWPEACLSEPGKFVPGKHPRKQITNARCQILRVPSERDFFDASIWIGQADPHLQLVRETAICNPVRKTQGYLCAYWREENTMFNELLESTLVMKDTDKSWMVVLSTLVQTLIVGVLVLMPLMHTEGLPKTMLSVDL